MQTLFSFQVRAGLKIEPFQFLLQLRSTGFATRDRVEQIQLHYTYLHHNTKRTWQMRSVFGTSVVLFACRDRNIREELVNAHGAKNMHFVSARFESRASGHRKTYVKKQTEKKIQDERRPGRQHARAVMPKSLGTNNGSVKPEAEVSKEKPEAASTTRRVS